jgi:hypothetical protein
MIARLGLAALAAALAFGCSNNAPPAEQQWTKQNATPEDVKRDLYWCTRRTATRPQALETPALGRPRTKQEVDDECMEQRGYTKLAPKS